MIIIELKYLMDASAFPSSRFFLYIILVFSSKMQLQFSLKKKEKAMNIICTEKHRTLTISF